MSEPHCSWGPCALVRDGYSVYCTKHREEARRNVLRSLGFAAPTSLMWRAGDEEWLMPTTKDPAR